MADNTPEEVAATKARDERDVANTDKINTKLLALIAQLEDADANWGALTAAQRTAVQRLAIRAAAKLIRLQLRQLETD